MIFVVFRGAGFLVIGYLLLTILLTNVVADVLLGAGAFGSSFAWPGAAIVAAGALTYVTGRRWNRGGPVPIIRRRDESAPFTPRLPFLFAPHSFIFVPMEAWGLVEIVIGAMAVVRSIIRV